jgi:hypothetical protein
MRTSHEPKTLALFSAFLAGGSLLCALNLSGCGKSLSRLTPDQQTAIEETLASAARAKDAVPQSPNAAAPHGIEFEEIVRFQSLTWTAPARRRGVARESDRAQDSMRTRLAQERDAKHCDVQSHSDPGSLGFDSSGALTVPQLNVSVQGASCPLSLSLHLTSGDSSASGTRQASFQCDYQVRDSSYARLNDVDAMQLSGGLRIRGAPGSALDASLDISGRIHSQKHGMIQVKFDGELSGTASFRSSSVEGSLTARLEFPDFTVELKEISKGGSQHYFVNGDEISENEFARYFQNIGLGRNR